MKVKKVVILLALFSFIVIGCTAQQSPRSSYVSMENQFIALGQQYDIYYEAGMVPAATHERFLTLMRSADVALDLYRASILGGGVGDEFYLELNRLKTILIMELFKLSEKEG